MIKKNTRRNIRKSYFIDAAAKIIEEEGIEAITVRKVTDMAGYNSSTLYNYFENLDHLVFLAAMKFIKDYTYHLPKYIKSAKTSLERYIKIWECFCHYSFIRPEIYYTLFYSKLNISIKDAVREYYSIYPDDLGEQSDKLENMLLEQDMFERGITILKPCVEEGFIDGDELTELNDVHILIYQGMVSRIINKQIDYSLEEAEQVTMKYLKNTLNKYLKRVL